MDETNAFSLAVLCIMYREEPLGGVDMAGLEPIGDLHLGSDDDHQPLAGPAHADIQAQLARILVSAEFAASARLQKFLSFLVAETLAGRSDRLKEYPIAIDVFERDESFDPQTSSIVRVEASRLRSKLDKYNAIGGRDDAVRISLKLGSYVPSFEHAATAAASVEIETEIPTISATAPPKQRFAAVFIVVSVLAIAIYLVLDVWLMTRGKEPSSVALDMTYSVAVLPLRNLSGDSSEDYFGDGMTDALITGLARERVAHVTSMTSVMAYKNVDRPLPAIASELGVSHLVEGSVMRVGENVRITVQLIEAATDRHLWAESYEGEMSDVLALQRDVVQRIVASMAQHVTAVGAPAPTRIADIDPQAYEAHLKGRFFLNKMTEDGFEKGIDYFKQAIEKAPDFAPAHSGMAACYCLLGGHGFELVLPAEGMPAAKKAVMESLRLDSSRAEPHAFLGIIQLKYDWDWRSAEESFTRAIALNPSYSRGHIFYSFYLEAMGRQNEAVSQAEAARTLDPLSRAANINLGWQYLQADRLSDAKQTFERATEIYPGHWGVHWGMGQYYLRAGEIEAAIASFELSRAAGGGHAMPLSALGFAYAISGHAERARDALGQLQALRDETYVSPYHMAVVHAALGDKDTAFQLLDEAYDLRSRSMAWLNVAPEIESLRDDPRFDALLLRVGLEG